MLLLVSGPLSRRSALCAALLTPLAPPCRPRSASAAGDVLYNLPMYCVPGVTSDRCRGVFWETGKLYKKDSSSQELKDDEYGALLASLRAQRKALDGLRTLAELGSSKEVGRAVAEARPEIRRDGNRLCRSLNEEARYDSQYALDELLAGLGDIDKSSLMAPDALPPGFTLSLMLKGTLCGPPRSTRHAHARDACPLLCGRKRFDEFLELLPQTPSAGEPS